MVCRTFTNFAYKEFPANIHFLNVCIRKDDNTFTSDIEHLLKSTSNFQIKFLIYVGSNPSTYYGFLVSYIHNNIRFIHI